MNRFPTAADIDAILPDTAVWLERADGHAGWANSRAMTMAGINATTKSPEGGRIEMTGGKPNGQERKRGVEGKDGVGGRGYGGRLTINKTSKKKVTYRIKQEQ